MANRIVLSLLALAAVARASDINVGMNTGRKIYDEKLEASPALWRQNQNVTVSTNNSEVISRIVITDLRPDKDGDAKIVEGGEGQQNVTIELKSPTVLRGYDFHIEVFAVPEGSLGHSHTHGAAEPALVGDFKPQGTAKTIHPDFSKPKTNLDSVPESATKKDLPQSTNTAKVSTSITKDITTPSTAKDSSTLKTSPSFAGQGITTPKNYQIKNDDKVLPMHPFNIGSNEPADVKNLDQETRHARNTQGNKDETHQFPSDVKNVRPNVPSTHGHTVPQVSTTQKDSKVETTSFVPLRGASDFEQASHKPNLKNNDDSFIMETREMKMDNDFIRQMMDGNVNPTFAAKDATTQKVDLKISTTEQPRKARDTITEATQKADVRNTTGNSADHNLKNNPQTIAQEKLNSQSPGFPKNTDSTPYPGLKLPITSTPNTASTTIKSAAKESDESDEDFSHFQFSISTGAPIPLGNSKNIDVKKPQHATV